MDIIKRASATILHIYNCDLQFCCRTQTWPVANMYFHSHTFLGIFRCFENLIWSSSCRCWRGIAINNATTIFQLAKIKGRVKWYKTYSSENIRKWHVEISITQIQYRNYFYTCMDWQPTSLLLDMRSMYVHVFCCPVPTEPETINWHRL
jgi:hypothetical protein